MASAPWVVSDELWGLVEPLLPKRERRFLLEGRLKANPRDEEGWIRLMRSRMVLGEAGKGYRVRTEALQAAAIPPAGEAEPSRTGTWGSGGMRGAAVCLVAARLWRFGRWVARRGAPESGDDSFVWVGVVCGAVG